MIGNDIVDLALAQKESNWRRKGFLEKIFTVHEQQLIRVAVDPDQMVWLLWSMKESAYKVAVRDSGKRRFAPIQLACDLTRLDDKNAEGIIRYGEKEYLTKSLLTAQYIATVSANKYILPDRSTDGAAFSILVRACRINSSFGVRGLGSWRQPRSLSDSARLICSYLTHSAHHSWFDNIIVPLDEMAYPQQHTTLWKKIKQHCSAALLVAEEEIHFHKDEAGAPWMTLPSAEKVPLSVAHHGRFGAFVVSSPQS